MKTTTLDKAFTMIYRSRSNTSIAICIKAYKNGTFNFVPFCCEHRVFFDNEEIAKQLIEIKNNEHVRKQLKQLIKKYGIERTFDSGFDQNIVETWKYCKCRSIPTELVALTIDGFKCYVRPTTFEYLKNINPQIENCLCA